MNFDQNLKKTYKGGTFIFRKKNEKNGISTGKIDFLNNFDKTWCSRENSKIMIFDQKLKKN